MDNIFGQRFYGFGEGAWHNKGNVGLEPIEASEAWKQLTPYWLEKRPVTVFLNGIQQTVRDFAIVRSALPDDPQERIMGYVAGNYTILQPEDICRLFDENVKQPVNTLGCLGKGEKLFLTWQLPKIDVKGDEVKTYGFVAGGFDGLYGVSLYLTTVRVVCQNTWMMAINEAESSKQTDKVKTGKIWSGRHNSQNVERDLGIWLEHVQQKAEGKINQASEIFNLMAGKAIEDVKVAEKLVNQIYPNPKSLPKDFPDRLRAEKQGKIDILASKAESDRAMVMALFGGQGTAIDATAWGLFNAVTEAENHVRVEKKPANNSVLFGARAKQMTKAFDVISTFSKGK